MVLAVLALPMAAVAGGQTRWEPVPPLKNPALLNIGFVCGWQAACITKQTRAMRSSLQYVKTHKIRARKIQLCNRNASRNGTRKDWIGFNKCIRNPALGRARR